MPDLPALLRELAIGSGHEDGALPLPAGKSRHAALLARAVRDLVSRPSDTELQAARLVRRLRAALYVAADEQHT